MRLGCVIFPHVEELDFIGPWEIAGMWGSRFNGPQERLVVAQSHEAVTCAKGLQVLPHIEFSRCPQLDILIVPGGQGTRTEVDNPQLINFINTQSRGCSAILSVCTGVFLLERAGLLADKKATTHWASLDRLRALGNGKVQVCETRFTRDGSIWTSAGVSAGIDLMLAFIAETAGPEVAGKVQLATEYYPAPTRYGQAWQSPDAPGYLKETNRPH
ncbi:MAG: DJ-1/PfpI family protein [Desulfobulbus sp.]|nr:DJ-1/PfpI family protein [Desulfobulbus sp.]